MVVAVLAGLGIPELDERIERSVTLTFAGTVDSARSILTTIATVTVSVAGLAFSVTVVALVLAAQQLSPRVMRTFRSDRLNQLVLGMFVGTFVYALLVLRSVGAGGSEVFVPDIAVTVAVVAAVVAFALFVAFIHDMVHALEASTVIHRIAVDGRDAIDDPFPRGVGDPPGDGALAAREVDERRRAPAVEVRASRGGFLRNVEGSAIVEAASERDALVVQRMAIGDFAVSGDLLAEVWCDDGERDAMDRCVCEGFRLGEERTPVHDLRFALRQLADIALKGLSPGLNDVTTAENAMNSIGETLIAIARQPREPIVRVDSSGTARFVACVPDLGGMVRLSFDQVRRDAASHPTLCVRLLELLAAVRREASGDDGLSEIERQARLIRDAVEEAVPTQADAALVEDAYERFFAPDRVLAGLRSRTESPP